MNPAVSPHYKIFEEAKKAEPKNYSTYKGDLGTGTFSDLAFLYQSEAKETNDATSYLGML